MDASNPQRDVDRWNARIKIGDLVQYRSHPEAKPQTFNTRTEASVLSGHTAVVWLEGKSGCVCCDACKLVVNSWPWPVDWRDEITEKAQPKVA